MRGARTWHDHEREETRTNQARYSVVLASVVVRRYYNDMQSAFGRSGRDIKMNVFTDGTGSSHPHALSFEV